eukprot:32613-Eustigmatos_ZCMA.PRE.1
MPAHISEGDIHQGIPVRGGWETAPWQRQLEGLQESGCPIVSQGGQPGRKAAARHAAVYEP